MIMFRYLICALLLLLSTSCFADHKMTVVHGDDNWAPNEFRDSNGQLSGIHIDLIRMAAAELNIELEFVAVPWQRALNMMKQGQADAISYAGYSEERAKYLVYLPGNIINQTQTRYIYRVDEDFQQIISDSEQRKLGIIRGYDYGKSFDPKLFQEVVLGSKEDQLVDMLLGGRIDLILLNFQRLRYQMLGDKRLARMTASDQVILQHDIYLAFARQRNRHIYARRFAEVIPRIRASQAYQQKVEGYFQRPAD